MSKKKLPAPNPPTLSNFTADLGGFGRQAANLDFNNPMMREAISTDPEVTKLALQYAQNALTPAWEANLKNIRNEAANAGALQSSTFTDALTTAGKDLQSQYQAITTNAALEDRSRALNNRVSLFGNGLNAIGSAAGQENQFNLANYENQLAAWELNKKQQRGGLMGGLTGAAGGAMIGLALAPFTGGLSIPIGAALGGAAGGAGPEGLGGQLLSGGSGMAGGMGGLMGGSAPRSSATNSGLSSAGGIRINSDTARSMGLII